MTHKPGTLKKLEQLSNRLFAVACELDCLNDGPGDQALHCFYEVVYGAAADLALYVGALERQAQQQWIQDMEVKQWLESG